MRESKYLNVYGGILLLSIIASVSSQLIHELMTPEELEQTFDTTENLPDYKVSSIRFKSVHESAQYGTVFIDLRSFDENVKMWLEPIEGVLFSDETPIYSIHSSPPSKFGIWKDGLKIIKPRLYSNYETYTTMAMIPGANRLKRMVGIIGSKNIVIRPIPSRLVANVTRYRRSVDGIPESEHDDHHYHIIFKRTTYYSLQSLPSLLTFILPSRDTAYPEVLVIADYNIYKKFNKEFEEIMLYLMAFWNGVDLMFRNFKDPKIRLHISQVILAADENALSYLNENKFISSKYAVNVTQAFEDFGYWLLEDLSPILSDNDFDLAVTMTNANLCDSVTNDLCKNAVLGVANPGGACSRYGRSKSLKGAFILDTGVFQGIDWAAHELGHLFGIEHDEENINQCSENQGYIMAPMNQDTINARTWSNCSVREMANNLLNKGCLFNKPKSGRKISRFLPGKIRDANQQCIDRGMIGAYIIDESTCSVLKCLKSIFPLNIIQKYIILDGTPCGVGKMCVNKKCILESSIEN